MSLTLPDIGRIAHLARLELDQAHAERMLSRLNGFFDLVEQMQAVDTKLRCGKARFLLRRDGLVAF